MDVLSPVTAKDATIKETEIPVDLIVERYWMLGLDVRRYFNNIKFVEIRSCVATGYRFYYPFEIFGDDLFYEELQSNYSSYYAERWEHFTALGLLDAGETVLEVGSGSGYFLTLLQKKGIIANGLELNGLAVQEGLKKGLKIENRLLENYAQEHTTSYDAVCSFQVVEHISDIKSYFEHALMVLKKGGRIIIGVPNNNPYIFKYDKYHTLNLPPHHAGLWNKEAFEQMPKCFPIQLKKIFIEPLTEYKEWYQAQINHYREKKSFQATLLQLIPRPLYKSILKLLRNRIQGRNIIAVFEKL